MAEEDLFASRPFAYAKATLDSMMEFLSNDAGEVEPFQLQVLCQHVEHQVAAKQQTRSTVVVDDALLGGRKVMTHVLERFSHIVDDLIGKPGRAVGAQ